MTKVQREYVRAWLIGLGYQIPERRGGHTGEYAIGAIRAGWPHPADIGYRRLTNQTPFTFISLTSKEETGINNLYKAMPHIKSLEVIACIKEVLAIHEVCDNNEK